MDIVQLIISLVSGAIGGNVAGKAMKDKSLGTLGDSLTGILGGGIGGAILQYLGLAVKAAEANGIDLTQILSNVAGGGVGGGILMVIIAILRGAANKSK